VGLLPSSVRGEFQIPELPLVAICLYETCELAARRLSLHTISLALQKYCSTVYLMRHRDIIQLDHNFLPKDRVRWDIRCCYVCLSMFAIGSYALTFVSGYYYCHKQGADCKIF
jgi:hypothetical protein